MRMPHAFVMICEVLLLLVDEDVFDVVDDVTPFDDDDDAGNNIESNRSFII